MDQVDWSIFATGTFYQLAFANCNKPANFQALRKEGVGAFLPGHLLEHLIYEAAWLVGKGLPRKIKILTGKEKLRLDPGILMEGYTHHTRWLDEEMSENRRALKFWVSVF